MGPLTKVVDAVVVVVPIKGDNWMILGAAADATGAEVTIGTRVSDRIPSHATPLIERALTLMCAI